MMFMLIYRLGFELYVWFDDKIYIERYYDIVCAIQTGIIIAATVL